MAGLFTHKWILCMLSLIMTTYTMADHCTWEHCHKVWFLESYTYCLETKSNIAYCQNYVEYDRCEEQLDCLGKLFAGNVYHNFEVNVEKPRDYNLFRVNLDHIVKVTMTDGDLTTIPNDVYNMWRLREIKITGNKIKEVNFYNFLSMSRLEKIELNNNIINAIEVNEVSSRQSNVESIDLSYNSIEVIPKSFLKRFNSLKHLDLSHNRIIGLQRGTFIHLNNLRDLNLYAYNITSIQYGAFEGLQKLSKLDLSNNRLDSFDPALVEYSIDKLYLDDNFIVDFKFRHFVSIVKSELSVGGNQIPCDTLDELRFSDLSVEFKKIVTAKKLSYYTENVGGISCLNNIW